MNSEEKKTSSLRVAWVTPYPAVSVLDESLIRKKYLSKALSKHATPWVRALLTGSKKLPDVEFGLFVHTREIARPLIKQEGNVRYFFIPKYEPGNFDHILRHLTARFQVLPFLRKFKPDVVVGFGTESYGADVAVSSGFPCVLFVQGIQEYLAAYYSGSPRRMRLKVQLEKKALQKAQGIIAETQFAEKWARKMNPRALIQAIPHGYNPDFLQVESTYDPNILCVGTLSETKGVETVLKAFCHGVQSGLPGFETARLAFAGSGGLTARLERIAVESGCCSQVDFHGHCSREKILGLMGVSRVLVLGSRMDTSPNVITEAHAAALPIVATRAGGIPDMVDEGEDGLLVDVDDVSGMAEALSVYLNDRDVAKQAGGNGRRKVLKLNDPCQIVRQHVEFYKKVAGRRK